MSSAIDVVQTKSGKAPANWSLWLRQIGAIFRMEIEKNFFSRRSLLIYLIAFLPLFPLTVLAFFTPPGREWQDFNQYSLVYSFIYNAFIMRTLVFFGSAWIFLNLFRGELVDRSLHYYFLSAVRRDVLVVGKYLSGLATSIILFTATTVIAMVLLYGWEWLNFLLPPLLKKISVIHYLNSLVPVPLSEGPFAVVAEPTPAYIAVPSMLVVTLL